MDTILLRFRDFAVDTIKEHQRLIADAGFTWWGWWKKSEEPDRADDLARLKAKLATGAIEIGLFDRSDPNRFFAGFVSDCVYGEKSQRIASPVPAATPQYYRDEKLAAWFKLQGIQSLSKGDPKFDHLFSSVPIGTETLFPILAGEREGSNAGGRSDLVIAPGKVVGTQILHLSDLHFGEYAYPIQPTPGCAPLDDILTSDLQKIGASVGILIFSGDFTTRADANRLFNEVIPFLRKLADRLKLDPAQIVMVPGNHDIPLRDVAGADKLDYSHENAYLTFLREFYGRKTDVMQLHKYELGNGVKAEILTMNSVRLRAPNQKQYGYVQWPLYEGLLSSVPASPETIRIAVLHHHLVPAPVEEAIDPEYSEAGMSVTLDAGSIIEGLQRHKFQLALHGHQHVPRLTKIARGIVLDDSFTLGGLDDWLCIVAAGSVGTTRLFSEMRDNTYTLLSFKTRTQMELRVRRFNSGSPPRDHIRHTLSL